MAFADHGVAGASIEDICAAAGFSRGAFYSNFSNKDELVKVLLAESWDRNQAEVERLYEVSDDAESFITAMNSPDRAQTVPVAAPGLLFMDLTLYAMRDPVNRPWLAERHRHSHAAVSGFLARIAADLDIEIPGGLDDAATLLLALDTGLLFRDLVDPERRDDSAWTRLVMTLHQLWTQPNTVE